MPYFFSQPFNKKEPPYGACEKEILALVLAAQKWRIIYFGIFFSVCVNKSSMFGIFIDIEDIN